MPSSLPQPVITPFPPLVLAGILLLLTMLLLPLYGKTDQRYFPRGEISVGSAGVLEYLGVSTMDRLACEEQLARIVQPLLARCALCRKATLECVRERNDTQFHRLTANRLPWPSTRYPDGSSIVYRFSNPALALLLCQSSEDISRQTQRPLPCAPAYSERFHVPG